jgi:hypothetical protein
MKPRAPSILTKLEAAKREVKSSPASLKGEELANWNCFTEKYVAGELDGVPLTSLLEIVRSSTGLDFTYEGFVYWIRKLRSRRDKEKSQVC